MDAPIHIEFALADRIEGTDISPRTIGLSQFNEYNQQVEAFILGSEKVKLDRVQVEILDGSYVLRAVFLSASALLASLQSDLALLHRQDSLGEVDPKRAKVMETWQSRAKATPGLRYEIRPGGLPLPGIRIDGESDYRVGDVVPWVQVEKYLFGQLVDMGGAQKTNVHLKLEDTGKIIIVGASQDYLRSQEANRLYHRVLLHVAAEQHSRTGEMRNARLIAFMDYDPAYDEEALDRFADAGAKAWADVPDAARWVRELRGA